VALEVSPLVINSWLSSLFLFIVGLFAVLNGPLWLSLRLRVPDGCRQAPVWLTRWVFRSSRLLGLLMLTNWVWVSTGTPVPALLLGTIVATGLFCLLDGPDYLVTRFPVFHRGPEAPAWLGGKTVWFPRLAGVVILLAALGSGIWAVAG
jgi:hypothetical protein